MDEAAALSSSWLEDRLIAAFKVLPGHPVFSARGSVNVVGAPDASQALTWAARFVPDRSERLVLLTWARCRATGDSFRDRCHAMGWSRSSAERTRQRAIAKIASCLKSEQLGLDSGASRPGASQINEADEGLAAI